LQVKSNGIYERKEANIIYFIVAAAVVVVRLIMVIDYAAGD